MSWYSLLHELTSISLYSDNFTHPSSATPTPTRNQPVQENPTNTMRQPCCRTLFFMPSCSRDQSPTGSSLWGRFLPSTLILCSCETFKHRFLPQDHAVSSSTPGQSEPQLKFSEGCEGSLCYSLETTGPVQETDPAPQTQVDHQVTIISTLYCRKTEKCVCICYSQGKKWGRRVSRPDGSDCSGPTALRNP